MIVGEVTPNREVVIRLELRGTSGVCVPVQAVLDTGFTEYLALPAAIVRQLGWPKIYTDRMMLADRSIVVFDVFDGVIDWHGQDRAIEVHAGGDVLIGMSLLYGSRLTVDVVDGGPLTIESLPVP